MRLKQVIIYIFAFCILGFIQKPGLVINASIIEDSLENTKSFEISEYDNAEERYIDFNCASISQGERSINPSRNNSNSVSYRNLNYSKKSLNSDSYINSEGKMVYVSGTSTEMNSLKLYPSGFLADKSFFISLRKFFI